MAQETKTALVVEGGGMRGIFAAGVLDTFQEEGIPSFDLYLGVSSGANNLAAYLAGDIGRSRKIIIDYCGRPEFINKWRFLRGSHYMDLDWLWQTLEAEMPIDHRQILERSRQNPFLIVCTDVRRGMPIYLSPRTPEELQLYTKGSSSVPIAYRNLIEINGGPVLDGGVSDPIPVIEAYRRGARKIMVIRSRPKSYLRQKNSEIMLGSLWYRKYPRCRKAIHNLVDDYNASIEFIRNPPPDTEILEVNPRETFQTQRMTRDPIILEADYRMGRETGQQLVYDLWRSPDDKSHGYRGKYHPGAFSSNPGPHRPRLHG